MKLILTAIIVAVLMACTPSKNSTPSKSIDMLDINGNSKPQEGGVDVGPKGKQPRFYVIYKKSLRPVPTTQFLVSVSFGWKEKALSNGMEINHYDGSKITITKSSIDGTESAPTMASLKVYLKTKYPERNYSDIQINGSIGVSAELANADGRLETDIYLVSELKDFVHVQMKLQHKDMVLVDGQSVLASIQTKRDGETIPLSMSKHVTIRAGIKSAEVPLEFAQSSSTSLKLSHLKKGNSYIVEVTSAKGSADFELIKAVGQEITLGDGIIVPVEGIYSVLQSCNDRTLPRNTINLKVGGVYIVRTENGIFLDTVTKLLVESMDEGKSVTLKYQTLLTVSSGIIIEN